MELSGNGVETLLKQMVDELGETEVARRIGYSKSAICHVMNGSYRGNPEKVLAAVRLVFDATPVPCPVLGEITLGRCAHERTRPFRATNPVRVRLAKTCRACTQGGNHGQ